MIALQLVLFCALFTLMVKLAVGSSALNGLYFYPKPVQEKVFELPFVQTWPQVLKKRGILTLIWIVGAAVVAGIVVLLF